MRWQHLEDEFPPEEEESSDDSVKTMLRDWDGWGEDPLLDYDDPGRVGD